MPEQRRELREHHRRRAPDARAAEIEERHVVLATVAEPAAAPQARRIEEIAERHLEDARDLAIGRPEVGPAIGEADDGVEHEAADRDVHRRQRADDARVARLDSDFLARFAQSGLLDGFVGVERPAGERHLPAVLRERVGPDGQHEVRLGLDRIEQEQAGRAAGVLRVVAGPPVGRPRPRRQPVLGLNAGQGCGERAAQSGFEISEGDHGHVNAKRKNDPESAPMVPRARSAFLAARRVV